MIGMLPDPSEHGPARALDITRETCPMTTVRTRLALDALAPGELLAVRLRGEEPRRGVPDFVARLGHIVVASTDEPDDVTSLLIRKR